MTRDGKWWMIHIPKIDGLTQARRLSEVEKLAREYIAITEDVAMSSFNINITAVHAADVDVEATQNLVASLRACRAQLDEALSEVTKTAAVTLTARDIPVRDVGETLGVSHQRVFRSWLLRPAPAPSPASSGRSCGSSASG